MATINSASGVSNMFVNNYGIKNTGMGGLMSGLDTDSLVEALTAGTRAKIAKQGQQRQTLKWKQTAYRDVASALRAFQDKRFKFVSASAASTIASEAFFNTYKGSSSSSKVSLISSATTNVGTIAIDEIKQLASQEKITVNKEYGKGLTGKERKFEDQNFIGQTLQLQVGKDSVKTIRLDSLQGKTGAAFEEQLQSLIDTAVGTRTAMVADDTKGVNDPARYEAGAFDDGSGNWVTHIVEAKIVPGTGGYSMLELSSDREQVLVNSDSAPLGLTQNQVNTIDKSTLLKDVFTDMKDDTYKFKINGVEIEINMKEDTVQDLMDKVTSSAAGVNLSYNDRNKKFEFTAKLAGAGTNIVMEDVQGRFLNNFVGAYGSNNMSSTTSVINMGHNTKITNNGAWKTDDLEAYFVDPANAGKVFAFDLTIDGVTKTISFKVPEEDMEDDGVTGKGTYGGVTARKYLMDTVQGGITKAFGAHTSIFFGIDNLDGVEMIVPYSKDIVLSDHTGQIDGVTPESFLSLAGITKADNRQPENGDLTRLGITGSGAITFEVEGQTVTVDYDATGADPSKPKTIQDLVDKINQDVGQAVLGRDIITYAGGMLKLDMGVGDNDKPVALVFEDSGTAGSSAMEKIFGVKKMDGSMDTSKHTRTAGQNAEIVVDGQVFHSANNTFEINGIAFTVSGTHKATDDPITLTSASDPTELVDKLKEFVAEYNGILETLYKLVLEEKEDGYSPLTDEQKADMTEDQIKKWETEAQKGLLRNDSAINSIISDLRNQMMGKVEAAGISLYDIGIEPESYYNMTSGSTLDFTKAGKLVVNEAKLRDSILKDPDKVRILFTDDDGIAQRLNSVISRAADTTSDPKKRGSLVRLAGTEGSSTADNTSTIGSRIETIDSYILTLKLRLETEYKRHWNKFTQLETALSRINTQSSWLADFGG